MRRPSFQVPLERNYIRKLGWHTPRVVLGLDVGTGSRGFRRVPFRLDTGADFTTLPIRLAEELGIPFARDASREVKPRTGAGRAPHPSFPGEIKYSFPDLPGYVFRTVCLFSPGIRGRGLLSLQSVIPNFTIMARHTVSGRNAGWLARLGRLQTWLHRRNRDGRIAELSRRQVPFGFAEFTLRTDHQGLAVTSRRA